MNEQVEKIKAEIERRKKRNKEEYGGDGLFEVQDNLNKLLSFIATLDETSEDLEEEIKQAIDRLEGCAIKDDGKITSHLVPIDALKDFAHHFAEWQKEQMLKEAVEGTYNNSDWGTPCIDLPSPLELERFDKIRIIILTQKKGIE